MEYGGKRYVAQRRTTSRSVRYRTRNLDAVFRQAEKDAKKRITLWKKISPPVERKIIAAMTHDRRLSKAAAAEFAFHMTDWIVDLQELSELFARNRWSAEKAQRTLANFVIHAPNHLAAAYRILWGDPLTDSFELGAVKGTGRAKRKPGQAYRRS